MASSPIDEATALQFSIQPCTIRFITTIFSPEVLLHALRNHLKLSWFTWHVRTLFSQGFSCIYLFFIVALFHLFSEFLRSNAAIAEDLAIRIVSLRVHQVFHQDWLTALEAFDLSVKSKTLGYHFALILLANLGSLFLFLSDVLRFDFMLSLTFAWVLLPYSSMYHNLLPLTRHLHWLTNSYSKVNF